MSYTDEQLLSFLSLPESQWIERKELFGDKEKVCKTICAFANDLAHTQRVGVVWFGVKDNGQLIGVDATDELLQKMEQIRSEGKIQPIPSLIVRVVEQDQRRFVAILVAPSSLPPVAYDGRIWVRVGVTTQLASLEDERLLGERRRAAVGRSFDSEGLPQTSLRDLNRHYFETVYLPQAVAKDVLEANGRTYEQRLIACRMASLTGATGEASPTVAGILTLGVSAQDWLAGAYIQYVRYAGVEHGGDVADQRTVAGNLEDVIKGVEEIFKAKLDAPVKVTGQDRDIRRTDYPLPALQQLFRNAVMHRNYEGTNAPVRVYWFDDRIEIASPGGPYGSVTAENFGQPHATDYRNPVVAEVMFNLGFAQKFGFGIQNAKKLLRENGNPDPIFEVTQSSVVVTIPKAVT